MRPSLPRVLLVPLAALILPILILSAGYLGYHSLLQSIIAQALKDEATPADAIVVFGAAIGANGRPGTILKGRINKAALLYKKSLAPRLILTGGIGWAPPAESIVAKRELIRLGIPDNAMILETRSTSTREQVAFTLNICREKGWKRLLLVSDPLHMYRLKLLFTQSGIQVHCTPARTVKIEKKALERYLRMEALKILAFRILGP